MSVLSDFRDENFVEEDENDADIIIIGAGLCGLTCAHNILKKEAGLDVLIIEANNHIGGRILSEDCSKTFHANPLQKHITRLVKALNINTYPRQNISGKRRIFYTKSGPVHNFPKFYAAEVHDFLLSMHENTVNPTFNTYTDNENAEELAETSVDVLLSRLVLIPCARSYCRGFICNTCGSRNLDSISALWLLVMLHGGNGLLNRLRVTIGDNNRYFIQGGIAKVAQELLKNILLQDGKIRYVEPVHKIQYNDDRAYVQTEQNCFKCHFVVIAVPPPENSHITIEPSPGQSWLSSRSLYLPGRNVFFNIIYKHLYWSNSYTGDVLTSWDSSTNLHFVYNATRINNTNETPILAGYLNEPNSTQNSKKELFETLYDCFKTTEAMNYLKYMEYDRLQYNALWNTRDDFSSPMSVLKPTRLFNHVNYIGVEYGRIFFASSEYAGSWPGTIDGAIQAGEMTAYSILSRIRPQALTFHEITKTVSRRIRQDNYSNFKMTTVQWLGIGLNIAIFLSFLRAACTNT